MSKKNCFNEINKELKSDVCEDDPISKLFDGVDITPATFQKSIDLFGKYFRHTTILNEIRDISEEDYFCFDIPRETANAWLDNRTNGMFLVRLSPKTPDTPFTLSYRANGVNVHSRISRVTTKNVPIRYKIKVKSNEVTSRNLPELIEQLKELGVVKATCPQQVEYDNYSQI